MPLLWGKSQHVSVPRGVWGDRRQDWDEGTKWEALVWTCVQEGFLGEGALGLCCMDKAGKQGWRK